MKIAAAVIAVWCAAGCATTNPRYTLQTVTLSRWCRLLLIQDVRTAACFVMVRCVRGGPTALTAAPAEVCAP